MIPAEILDRYGGERILLEKNEILFRTGDRAHFYYQIVTGEVRMYSLNEDGKEFTQGLFYETDSFGEPPLFIDKLYPSTAEALIPSEIIRLGRENFFNMLDENNSVNRILLQKISNQLYYKALMGKEISLHDPEHRIIALFDYLKTEPEPAPIQLTRQQIANLTALRVETVIRAIKSLEEKKVLSIKNRKVYY